jgi:hypothetical protein
MRKYFFILYCLGISTATAETFNKEIPHDKIFKSPDGRFSATEAVLITDTATGEVHGMAVMAPILGLRWAKDSRTIVIVSHLAGGSYGTVLHFNGDQWIKTEADVATPDQADYLAYKVIDTKDSSRSVSFTYRVSAKEHASQAYRHYCCEVKIDLDTGAHEERRVPCFR